MARWTWPALLMGPMLMTAWQPAAALPLTYGVTPKSTDIGFSVDVLGIATAEGEFHNFSGRLTVDVDDPNNCAVSIRIDTSSASMEWAPAERMVVGESYLDVEHYPEILFASQVVTQMGPHRVRMEGLLTLRGISHWESFDAQLVERHWDAERKQDVAEFAAIGSVHRSDYQMDADHGFLDDRVTFTIHTRVVLNPQTPTPVPIP